MSERCGHDLPPDYAPKRWILLGPFPNRALEIPGASGATREGYDRDYLAALAGEAGARLTPNTTVALPDESRPPGIRPQTATAVMVPAGPRGGVDFRSVFSGETDARTAYAYGEIVGAGDRVLSFHFGSDDSAKVWVDGRLVYGAWTPRGDGAAMGTGGPELANAFFTVPVKAGRTPVLVKVENDRGGWGFRLAAHDEAGEREWRHLRALEELPEQEIRLAEGGPFAFAASTFPPLEWRHRLLLDPLLSDARLSVRWFDRDAREVAAPDRDGLYFASIEGETREGAPVRRIVPIARLPRRWIETLWRFDWVREAMETLSERKPAAFPFADTAWPALRRLLFERTEPAFTRWVTESPEGIGLLGALAAGDPIPMSGRALEEELIGTQLRIRRKLLGRSGEPLERPTPVDPPVPALREGSATEAGMKPAVVEGMEALCQDWAQAGGQPFSLVLARGGVVFMHRAYGEREGRPYTRETPFYMASLGKAFTGLLFAQFVDQGLLDLDDPLGRVFPDFPPEGPKAVTFRQCFTHTSGFTGSAWFQGLRNPTLDNAFSLLLPQIDPGTEFCYREGGYRLVGKALELIAGQPFARLLREQLFDPLSASSIEQSDPGVGNAATALDVARVGQLLANRGAYGDRRFFSEETFKRLLPIRLAAIYPRLDDPVLEWGIGLSWMFDPGGFMRLNPRLRQENALGPNVIGHGSISSSIFRVDLDTGLVVVMGREGVGDPKSHQEYRAKAMTLLRECVDP